MKTFEGSRWEFFIYELKHYEWHYDYFLYTIVAIAAVAAIVFWVIFLLPTFLITYSLVAIIRCFQRARETWNHDTPLLFVV